MNSPWHSGIALIATLLILFVLSLLVMLSLESLWLENKISLNYLGYVQALHYADQGLDQAEASLKRGVKTQSISQAHFIYTVVLESEDLCGRKNYLIHSKGLRGREKISVQEKFILVPMVMSANCKKGLLKSQRLWWREAL